MYKGARYQPDVEADALPKRFHAAGVEVAEAVPAFSGLYPVFGGYGSWELFFTRWRLRARTKAGIEMWTAHSGPSPVKHLGSFPTSDLTVLRAGGRYDRVALGSRSFWVHGRYRDVLRRWTTT